jgi:hypothetical protein
LTRTVYKSSALEEGIEGDVAATMMAWRTMSGLRGRTEASCLEDRDGVEGGLVSRLLALFTVVRAAGRPAAAPTFKGERAQSSEGAQLAAANGAGRQGLLRSVSEWSSEQRERVTF